jgi:PAS domain S-box-containing protein
MDKQDKSIDALNARIRDLEQQLEQRAQERRVTDLILLALMESTGDPILLCDENAMPFAFNSSYAQKIKELLGIDMKPGMQPHTLLEDQDAKAWRDGLHRRVLAGEQFTVEYSHPAPGGPLFFEHSFNPMIKDGSVIGFSEFIRDITERKRMQEQDHLFKTMMDLSKAGAVVMDLNGRIIYANKAIGDMMRTDPAQAVGQHFNDFHTPEQHEEILAIPVQCLRVGSLPPRIIWHRRADGRLFPALTTGNTVCDSQGNPNYVFVTVIDVSDSVNTEQALRQSEERYRIMTEHSGDIISRHDLDGRYTFLSPAVRTLHGFEPEELIGDSPYDHIHPDDCLELRRLHQEILSGPVPFKNKHRFRHKNGQYTWVETHGTAVSDPVTGELKEFIGVTRDISDRMRTERALLDSPFTSAVLLDLDGIILDLNAVAAQRAGHARESLIGKCAYDFLPPDVAAMRREKIQQIVETGNPVQYEDRTPNRVLEAHLFPLKNDADRVYQIAAIGHDFTDMLRTQEEKQALLEQLFQSQKMEAVGQLAGGIAHDFNNILAVMMGGAEMLLRRSSSDDPARARIERIIKAGERGRDLTMKLLTFARREKLDMQSLSVPRLLDDVADMVRMSNIGGIRITMDSEPGLPSLCVDAGQITQTLLNICLNACDAMQDGGVLHLSAGRVVLSEPSRIAGQDLKPGAYCCIRAADNGAGIPDNIRERIFEPFFTTKEKGKGTGLGLSVALGIAQSHNGAIDIKSGPGAGTTVSLLLPFGEKYRVEHVRPQNQETPARAPRTVLIVDDNEDYLCMLADSLDMEGFAVITASSGAKAVEIFMDRRREIDVALLDMIMPGMGGSQTFYALREVDPRACIVICSGFSVEGKASQLLNDGAAAFLQKPFGMGELHRCLAAVMADNE